jgi:hypothetical protein
MTMAAAPNLDIVEDIYIQATSFTKLDFTYYQTLLLIC